MPYELPSIIIRREVRTLSKYKSVSQNKTTLLAMYGWHLARVAFYGSPNRSSVRTSLFALGWPHFHKIHLNSRVAQKKWMRPHGLIPLFFLTILWKPIKGRLWFSAWSFFLRIFGNVRRMLWYRFGPSLGLMRQWKQGWVGVITRANKGVRLHYPIKHVRLVIQIQN